MRGDGRSCAKAERMNFTKIIIENAYISELEPFSKHDERNKNKF